VVLTFFAGLGVVIGGLWVAWYFATTGHLAPLPRELRSVARFQAVDNASVREMARQFQAIIRDVGEPIVSSPSSKRGGRPGVALALLDAGSKPVAFHGKRSAEDVP
jgi:hypothetical protein